MFEIIILTVFGTEMDLTTTEYGAEDWIHLKTMIGAGIAQSVLPLATGWTVCGSNPGGGGDIFRTRPDLPWGPPSLLYNEYRVFTGGKAAGA